MIHFNKTKPYTAWSTCVVSHMYSLFIDKSKERIIIKRTYHILLYKHPHPIDAFLWFGDDITYIIYCDNFAEF